MVKGIGVSIGFAYAKAFKLEEEQLNIVKREISNAEDEVLRFEEAVSEAIVDLRTLKDISKDKIGVENAKLFDAHILLAQDPEMGNQVKLLIKNEMINTEYALKKISDQFVSIFESMNDEYMQERAADIKDVVNRVMRKLLGLSNIDLSMINEDSIVVANDLTPSETAQLNKEFTKGFVTNIGGRTSHSAIMARTLEIPAVVGTNNAMEVINDGDYLLLDGTNGEVIINPTEEQVNEYFLKSESLNKQRDIWKLYANKQSITKDGKELEISANIGSVSDVETAIKNGADGIGLFRTEFLYMDRDTFPSEKEQFLSYKSVLEAMGSKPVVIRTLDIGGDKQLPYWNLPEELNPFLGERATRLCLTNSEVFKVQLRALLRASAYGNMKIMFPMIATIGDLKKVLNVLDDVKDELSEAGIPINPSLEVGIMIEIPSAAIQAEKMAKYVDFFSIGTNDLIQYTMAADRMNERVSYLYQPYHPAILQLIKITVDGARKHNKWVGMCGEMAGDPNAFSILFGLGIEEFSMSATSIPQVRYTASGINSSDAIDIAKSALECEREFEVLELLQVR